MVLLLLFYYDRHHTVATAEGCRFSSTTSVAAEPAARTSMLKKILRQPIQYILRFRHSPYEFNCGIYSTVFVDRAYAT